MWKRSFRARLLSKSESGKCENEAFVRDVPQKVKVEAVRSLGCEISIYIGIYFSGIVKWNIKYYVLLFVYTIYVYIDCIVFFPNSIS